MALSFSSLICKRLGSLLNEKDTVEVKPSDSVSFLIEKYNKTLVEIIKKLSEYSYEENNPYPIFFPERNPNSKYYNKHLDCKTVQDIINACSGIGAVGEDACAVMLINNKQIN